jgi:lysosomal acid lipase/cholesteryl ester hydrolase
MYIPLLGRLSLREYAAVVLGLGAYALESLLRVIVLFLPARLVRWLHDLSRLAFYQFVLRVDPGKPKSPARARVDAIRDAQDFGELCALRGYTHEEHVVLTKDGYLLTLHRLPSKKGEGGVRPGVSTGKPVAYLHHGLLMNRYVRVLTAAERRLTCVQ